MRHHQNPIADHCRRICIWYVLVLLAMMIWPITSYAGAPLAKASIYAYFRIAQDDQPRFSIRMGQFDQHMRLLEKGNIQAIGLDGLIQGLKGNKALPAGSIAITFEGAHRSVAQKAVPLLKEGDIPFTIFIAPGRIDQDMPQYMSWRALRELQKSKLATIGVSLNRYRHGVALSEKQRKNALNRAIARYREEFGHRPRYFAYPYGEYDKNMREMVQDYGFRAAFGQQSGVAHSLSDLYTLPRFTMTEDYGDARRFRQTARALPLPISNVTPASPVLDENPPRIGFSLPDELDINGDDLQCYASNGAKIQREVIGETRVELRLKAPFVTRRGRVNCIAAKKQGENETITQRWRWHGMLFVIPDDLRSGGG